MPALTRTYAVALQDESQQALNAWLDVDAKEVTLAPANRIMKYKDYPSYAHRAAELLGSDHYMYASLKAREALFEGYLLRLQHVWGANPPLDAQVMSKYKQSLKWMPEAPYTNYFVQRDFMNNLSQPDSAIAYMQRAVALSPTWVLPYTDAAFGLTTIYHKYEQAKTYLDKALEIDPKSVMVLNSIGSWYYCQGHLGEAEDYYRKAISLDTNFAFTWVNLGVVYDDMNKLKEAESCYKRALAMDSTYYSAFNNLGFLYTRTKRWAEAESFIKTAIKLDPSDAYAWNNLGAVYLNLGRLTDAEREVKRSLAMDTTNAYAYDNLGQVYVAKNQRQEARVQYAHAMRLSPKFAEPYLHLAKLEMGEKNKPAALEQIKKALELGYADKKSLSADPDFVPLHKLQAWRDLKLNDYKP